MVDVRGEIVGTVLGGRYRVLGLLGEGGMGAVYSALQEDLNRRVAIKILQGDTLDDVIRLRQEALAAAEIRHPNIVQVTDFQAQPGEPPFLVMEVLEGESLRSLIQREGALPTARSVFIATQILTALEAAHAARIIHRDIKPANIFLSRTHVMTDLVKVLDFGIAKVLREEVRGPRTVTGAVLGTPAYMSPEQVLGITVDERSDIHAVGVCLFEMLAARRPYEAATGGELMMAIARQPALRLGDVAPYVDPHLAAVVSRALAKDPAARFPSAVAMIEALAPWTVRPSAPPARTSGTVESGERAPPPLRTENLTPFAPTLAGDTLREGPNATRPPPPATAGLPAPLKIAIGAVVVLMVLAVAASVWSMMRSQIIAATTSSGGAASGPAPAIATAGPLAGRRLHIQTSRGIRAGQVVGDPTEDLVARVSDRAEGYEGIAAYDGATMRPSWVLRLDDPSTRHLLAVAGGKVVANDGSRELLVADGATGALDRRVALPFAVVSLCAPAGAARDVWVEMTDVQSRLLDVATGTLREGAAIPKGCAPTDLASHAYQKAKRMVDAMRDGGAMRTPSAASTHRVEESEPRYKDCLHQAVCLNTKADLGAFSRGFTDGDVVVVWEGDPNDGLKVHGLDPSTHTPRWSKTLKRIAGDPIVDLVAGRLYVQEVSQSLDVFAMEAIDAHTGASLWRYEPPRRTGLGVFALPGEKFAIGPTRVFVGRRDQLDVLDVATGKELASISTD